MNCLEKRHVGHKANTQHLCYLDSFMDETDREVMNLTDRAFKSLCIGDEAIYNDSEFSPSPISCHKPLAEEVPKKTQEKFPLTFKKHGAHPPNGVHDTAWQINNNASLFSAFAAMKNGDAAKIMNGDSWDKSALLSIQRELSEFSTDCQNNVDGQCSQVKNHLKHSEKDNKTPKDISTPSQLNSTKGKHGKSSKLRKLNSKNFFLHSEFSPFQSWRDCNKFLFGLDNIDMNIDIFPSNGSPEWYDSPLYKKLTMSHTLHVPESRKGNMCRNTSLPVLQNRLEPQESQPTAQTLKTELNQTEPHTRTQVLLSSCSSEQRCQSEGDSSAPWRKNRSRAKSAAPVVQALMSSPACERTKAGEEGVLSNRKEIRTTEEETSSSSTPFSILQLLTPVIPSRQGTGSSEIHQAVLSPSSLDLPPLLETELRPSPEIKREGYKSKASSLLFNLKDNRKRVKTMYSPPKFKALDLAEQNKLSPLIEQVVTNNCEEVLDTPDARTTSPANVSPKDLLPKTADKHNSPASGHVHGSLLDDYLALSLLQSGSRGSPLKTNKSPVANKATYPSLNLYRKVSPIESDAKTMQTPGIPGSQPTTDQVTKQNIDHMPEKDGKELEQKHLNKPSDTNIECTLLNCAKTKAIDRRIENVNSASLKEKYPLALSKKHNTKPEALTPSGCTTLDKPSTGETGKVEQRLTEDKEYLTKEPKPKHFFSARQNSYIKSQRYVSGDDDDEENTEVSSIGRDVVKDNNDDVLSRKSGGTEGKGRKHDDAYDSQDYMTSINVLAACTEQRATSNDALSMKGNTSAKRAMFTSKKQVVATKSDVAPKKDNVVIDKYELAKMALEEVIAEREQRKKQSQSSDKDYVKQQDLVSQEHYKQATTSEKDKFESATKDRRGGQKGISDFKLSSQIVQSMSDRDTKHGKRHAAEVNLAGPSKQEGAAEYSQHAAGQIKYTERDRSGRRDRQCETDNVKPKDKVTELREKLSEPKNISLLKDSSRVANTDSQQTRQGVEGSAVQKRNKFYKPEVPPRRGRASSQSEEREVCETERKEDVRQRVETLVKNEESISREEKKVKSNLPKERGPVRGHVSSLKDKFNKEKVVPSIHVHECWTQEESSKDNSKKDKIKPKETTQNTSELEAASTKLEGTGMYSDKESEKVPAMNEKESLRECDSVEKDVQIVTNIKDDKEDITKKETECISEGLKELDDNQSKCSDHNTDILRGFLGKSDAEELEPDSEFVRESSKKTQDPPESCAITVYDILKQSKPSSPADVQLSNSFFSPQTEETEVDLTSQARKCEESVEQIIQNFSKPEGEASIFDRVISPPSDMDKGGWVRCLIESARNLTPSCQSNVSSPTLGKPVLFKVKDNTFSVCPVTKTVRPILHKRVIETTQPWSPRDSLSGSDRGEEDLFKECVEVQSPIILSPTPPSTPARSPQPNPSSSLLLLSSQFTAVRERKGQLDSLTVPEEDEMQSAVSSEGIESCATSTGDTMEENAPTEDTEDSKAPSERSGSACSGNENQVQTKPPVVPPKTEKALRRAMKLTSRRIQKAEAKSKSERKGRSSEKNADHKPERRHQSSDKVLSNRTHNIDNQSTGGTSNDVLLSKTDNGSRQHRDLESQSQQKDGSNESRLSNKAHAKNCINQKKIEEKLEQNHLCEVMSLEAPCERLGRTSMKYQPDKLDRRAQSLDRFLRSKLEYTLPSIDDRMSSEAPKKLCTTKKALLHQNSIEHAYAPTAASIVTQSFPMTQRKLLQDPDSGQYFVVDMPVQVKTKTFFDPETGSYVQLPVQSSEGGVPQAQSMEVVNAPPLVLYHGFVPMPVSSIPAQTSAVKLHSIVSPEELEVFESREMEKREDIYQKLKASGQPYIETEHASHEHLLEEGNNSVNR